MKKIILLTLLMSILISMVACGKSEPVQKVVKVGVCIYQFDDEFMTVYREELEKYLLGLSGEEIKYDFTILDGKNDQAEQTKQIEAFIADKVDVLIINPVQALSVADTISLVKAADIPTVFINREPTSDDMQLWDRITYVGSDFFHMQTPQGEIIADLPDKGDIDGDGTVGYIHIMGDDNCVDAKYQYYYAIKAIEAGGMKVNMLVGEKGMWDREKAQEITSAALEKYGDKVEVVVCNTDRMAMGAYQAIKEAGRTVNKDIYIIGIGALPEVVELIDKGEFTGTVHNDAIGQAHTAVDVAIKAVNGKKLDKKYTVDYIKIVRK